MHAWWAFALGASLASAVNGGLNRHFQVDGARLALAGAAAQALLLAPLVLWFRAGAPSVLFLAGAALSGLFLAVLDATLYTVAARFGGAVIPRVMAARIWVLFLAWAAIDQGYTRSLLSEPVVAGGVALALALGAASLYFMTRCPVTRAAALALLPAIAASVGFSLVTKLTIPHGAGLGGLALFALIIAVVEVLVIAVFVSWRARPGGRGSRGPLFSWAWAAPGLAVGTACLATRLLLMESLVLAPNPAYVHMVGLLSAVWLYATYFVLNIPDTRRPWAGLGLVASAALLVYLAPS